MNKPFWHQLIVLGNGFDIACGLKSQFSDFSSSRVSSLEEFRALRDKQGVRFLGEQHDVTNDLTVWDIILSQEQGDRWCDIESAIGRWVRGSSYEKTGVEPILRGIESIRDESHSDGFARVRRMSESRLPYYKAAEYVVMSCAPELVPTTESQMRAYLLSELHRMEEAFGAYLLEEVGRSVTYETDSSSLLAKIALDQCVNPQSFNISTSVLSFNYTRPRFPNLAVDGSVPFTNVHGRLGEEIVFGIDGHKHIDNTEIVPFTKTYRLMGLESVDTSLVVYQAAKSRDLAETAAIKFFGHSLGEADHSYFMALFDSVDLYSGWTKLVFYYRPHGDGSFDEQRRVTKIDMMNKVTALLASYGKSLNNAEHGKNLIHKLLLEGRLSVTELP